MLLTLMSIIITITGISLTILMVKKGWDDNLLAIIGAAILDIIGVISLLVCLVTILCTNTNVTHKTLKTKYEERVVELSNTREYISTITDDYARSVAVTQYNDKVRKYRTEIITYKSKANNVWISWLYNSEYKHLDGDVFQYIK